jgi:outer membrane immunogenic protein
MMHRLSAVLISGIAAIAFTQIASAADLPVKAPRSVSPAPPPPYSWTGCYVGANLGGGWQKSSATFVTESGIIFNDNNGSNTGSGVVGGGQLGCDYQMGSAVFGIQGMFDWTNMDGSNANPLFLANTLNTKAKWLATLTGRIGYAFQPQMLLYVKGGAAWVRNDYHDFSPSYDGYGSATRTGWTVGGGIEYAFARNWSVFAEYNYMDFGDKNVDIVDAAGGPPWVDNFKNSINEVLGGINYRF